MSDKNYRLYAGTQVSYYVTFDDAKQAAEAYIPHENYLRIEILIDIKPGEADWWAYEYDTKQWAPS